MNRDVLPLQNHFGMVVEQGIAVVVRQIEHAGTAGFFQGDGHFTLCRFQCAAHHRQGNRVYGAGGLHVFSPRCCHAMGQQYYEEQQPS